MFVFLHHTTQCNTQTHINSFVSNLCLIKPLHYTHNPSTRAITEHNTDTRLNTKVSYLQDGQDQGCHHTGRHVSGCRCLCVVTAPTVVVKELIVTSHSHISCTLISVLSLGPRQHLCERSARGARALWKRGSRGVRWRQHRAVSLPVLGASVWRRTANDSQPCVRVSVCVCMPVCPCVCVLCVPMCLYVCVHVCCVCVP